VTEEDEDDRSYIEVKLDVNDLTQSVFIKITDYSALDDMEEQYDVWENTVLSLKEIIGG
jgi:hypothetical protein